jgi:hypothetical protein
MSPETRRFIGTRIRRLEEAISFIQEHMVECHNKDVAINHIHSEINRLKEVD